MAEEQVKVRNLDTGEIGTVPASQAGAALRSGSFEQVSGEEYRKAELTERRRGLGQTVAATAEGAARGLTFGLSDVAARQLSPEYANAMAERKEAHPIASTVGEVGGAVAPVLLSGGTGAVGEAASLAPTSLVARLGEGAAGLGRAVVGEGAPSLLGRVAQRAVPLALQGGAEGAIYGAGQAVSESALGDEELTAQKLLAGAKGGALAGFIGGGALGSAFELGKYGAEKGIALAGETGLKDFLQSAADKATIRSLGANVRDVRAMGGMTKSAEKMEERISDIANEVRDFKFKDGEKLFGVTSTTEKLAEALPRARAEVGAELGSFRKEVGGIIKADPSLAPDVGGFLRRVDREVLEPMRMSAVPEIQARAGKVEQALDYLRRRMPQAPKEMAIPQPSKAFLEGIGGENVGDVIGLAKPRGGPSLQAPNAMDFAAGATPAPAIPTGQSGGSEWLTKSRLKAPEAGAFAPPPAEVLHKPITLDELTKVRQDFDGFLYPKSKSGIVIPPEHQAELQQVNRMLEDTIEETTERALAKAGNKEMLGKYAELKDSFRNLSDANRIVQDAEARATARNAVSLSDKMAGGAALAGSLATGAGGIPALGAAALSGAANHVANTYGNQAAAIAFNKLARISHATADVDAQISNSVRSIFEGAKTAAFKTAVDIPSLNPRPAMVARTPEKRYEQASGQLAQLTTQPDRSFDKMTEHVAPIASQAPKTAAKVVDVAMSAVKALEARRPQPSPSAQVGLVPAPATPPDDAARAKFLRQVDGTDPQKVMSLMRKGMLTKDEMDTHKEVFGKLYEQEVKQFTDEALKLAEKGKDLSYEKKIQASIFLGKPLDPTLTPQFIRNVQAMHKANGGGAQSQQAAPRNGAPKRQLNIAGSFQSPSDKIGGIT